MGVCVGLIGRKYIHDIHANVTSACYDKGTGKQDYAPTLKVTAREILKKRNEMYKEGRKRSI